MAPRAGQFLVAWAWDLCDSEGFLKRKNLHGLKIKASFFQISKACCGSDQLKQLPLSLPETTAVSTTQSGHCYQRQIWKNQSRHFKCGHPQQKVINHQEELFTMCYKNKSGTANISLAAFSLFALWLGRRRRSPRMKFGCQIMVLSLQIILISAPARTCQLVGVSEGPQGAGGTWHPPGGICSSAVWSHGTMLGSSCAC